MNFIKITDNREITTESKEYIMTEFASYEIRTLINAFQSFLWDYTDYGGSCIITKDMATCFLTTFCGCEQATEDEIFAMIPETEDGFDYWDIDIVDAVMDITADRFDYMPYVRKIKNTDFLNNLDDFFSNEDCTNLIYNIAFSTILKAC